MRFYVGDLREGMIVNTHSNVWTEVEWVASSPDQVIVKFTKFLRACTYSTEQTFLVKPSSCSVVI